MATKAEEAKWKAESDARFLVEAAAIKKDPTRYKAAVKEAKEMVKAETARVQALRSVAGMGPLSSGEKK